MRESKPKPIFRGLTISATGNLGGSAQWNDTNIARWVDVRKGKFVRDRVDEDVTHLVCSKGVFRKRGSLVKAALKRKACHIVTFDWLEDSIFAKRRLPEDKEPYSHRLALKKEHERERRRRMVIKGLEKAEKEVNPTLYHLYRDYTYFEYEVVLTREVVLTQDEEVPAKDEEKPTDGDEKARTQEEKYVLTLYESNNAKPHLYWFVAKFYKKKGDTQAKIYRPNHAPGIFAREFAEFTAFFRQKTGIPWEQRLVKAGTAGKDFFQYQPPLGGKPVGWAPAEYIPAEIPDIRMLDAGASTITTAPSNTTTAPVTNTNGNDDDIHSKIAALAAKMSDASAQNEHLITPAPSPRADHSITVAH